MLENTFVMMKPPHFPYASEIFNELDKFGERIKTAKIENVNEETIIEHYTLHKHKPFFPRLVKSFLNQPTAIAIYRGDNIVYEFMKILGPTNPSDDKERKTIRGKYSQDTYEAAGKEDRALQNVIHRSDSADEAYREINVWEKFFDKLKIYFSGSIQGGRKDVPIYRQLINHLSKYGDVLSKHIGEESLTDAGDTDLSDEEVYERDVAWLEEANKVIADVTVNSGGVHVETGILIGEARVKKEDLTSKAMVLYRPKELDRKVVTRMLKGSPIKPKAYNEIAEAKRHIDDFLLKG